MKFTQKCLIAVSTLAFTGLTSAGEINNWLSTAGEVWKNSSGECWRNSSWTPATAAPGCDGAISEQPKAAAAPAPAPAPAPADAASAPAEAASAPAEAASAPAEAASAPAEAASASAEAASASAPSPTEAPQVDKGPSAETDHSSSAASSAPAPEPEPEPAPAAVAAPAAPAAAPAPAALTAPAATKVTYAADTFFDFDKSVLKPAAKAKLDDLLDKIKSINLEVIIAIGHTDSVGSDEYNNKLSMRRSNAVKAYLVSKGVDKTRIYTEGKGESQPVADNKTKEGRAKNRRVEIEVVGARKN